MLSAADHLLCYTIGNLVSIAVRCTPCTSVLSRPLGRNHPTWLWRSVQTYELAAFN